MWIATSNELAQVVRAQRRARSLTQRELAKKIGVSRQWVISLEAGKPTTEVGLVLRALAALGLRMDVGDTSRAPDPQADSLRAATADVLARSRDPAAPVLRLQTAPPRAKARRTAGDPAQGGAA